MSFPHRQSRASRQRRRLTLESLETRQLLYAATYLNSTALDPMDFGDADGIEYFSASNTSQGTEVWKSDGTPGGTQVLRDIRPGSTGSFPHDFTNVNGTIFF